MATIKNEALDATQPQVPLTTHQHDKDAPGPDVARRNLREYHEWNRRCALELKKHDGLSTGARFFGAAFSLLFVGKERADLDRAIDRTIEAETSEENLNSFLHDSIRACGHRGDARAKQYVADYFADKETRNREKRFHDAVVFLLEEGFTREELHKLAAQAEEA